MLCYGLDTGMVEALGAVQPTLLREFQAIERLFSNNTKRKRGKEEKTECFETPKREPGVQPSETCFWRLTSRALRYI